MKEKYKKGRDYPYVGLKVTSLRTVVAFRRENRRSVSRLCMRNLDPLFSI